MGVENANDVLTAEILNLGIDHSRVRSLLESATSEISALFQAIDSGNREDAEAYAQNIAKENAKIFEC